MKNINTECYNDLFSLSFVILSLFIPSTTTATQFVQTIKDGDGIIDGLVNPNAVTVSPDHSHVYVVSEGASGDADASLVVFTRNPDTNHLIFIQTYKNNVAGVTGLEGAQSVTVSPDGQYVYVASDSLETGKKGHVLVFEREMDTGKVSSLEQYELVDADSVVASDDNKHVYVASGKDNAVLVFSRAEDGKLTQIEIKRNGEDGIEGLAGTKSLAIDSAGKYLYALGYDDNALVVFKREPNTGQLTFVERHINGENSVDGLANPHSLIISPDNKYIYVRGQITTQFGDENAIAIFRQETSNDSLTFVDTLSSSEIGLDDIDFISTTDHYFYIVNKKRLSVFNRDSNTGALTLVDEGEEKEGVDSSSAITVSSDGKHLYIVEHENEALLTFARDTTTGIPTLIETLPNGKIGVIEGLSEATSVAISPDNKHIYVAGKEDDAITVFHRDAETGELTLVDIQVDKQKNPSSPVEGLDGINSVVVSPDGKHVYATSENSNALVVFARNEITGVLRFIEWKQDGVDNIDGLNGASAVIVSPDNKYVYVTASNDNAVTVFIRDTNTGKLTFIEKQQDGVNGITGIFSASSLTISPDNQSLYVISLEGVEALTVFSRDINTGKLTFVETHEQTIENGIGFATSIVVSPDNKHVYLVRRKFLDKLGTIVLFERDLNTGKLTFIEKQTEGENNIKKLNSVNSVIVSPDGHHVYTLSGIFATDIDNALNIFSRHPQTGKLTFMTTKEEGIEDISGLKGANSIAISSDNNFLYVASTQDNAVTILTTITNQAPEIDFPATQLTISENTPLTFSTPNQITIRDADVFSHAIEVTLTATNGALTLNHSACQNNNPTKIICIGSLADSNTILTGMADINKVLTGMTFTPDNGFAGDASLKINVNDQGNTGGGDIGEVDKMITITVSSIIGSPAVSNAVTNVGTQTTHGLVISRGAGDGVEVSHFYITNIIGGTLFQNDGKTQISNNSFISFSQGNAGLRFKPNSANDGYFSTQSATCVQQSCLNSGIATATIHVNTAPVLTKIEDITVRVGETATLTTTATDRENHAFRFKLNDFEGADIDPNTGVFTWTPQKSGTYKFTILVTEVDAGISSKPESFTITVTTPPEWVDLIDNQTITYGHSVKFKVNATHREQSPLIYELINSPPTASIDKTTGDFVWKPDQAGKKSITIKVTETKHNQSVEKTIDVTIEKANTGLQFALDKAAIFKDGIININGKLTSYPNLGQNLANLKITLTIIPPVGEPIIKTIKTYSPEGLFALEALQVFNQVGRYEIQASFAGNQNLTTTQYSPPEYLQVQALAGYAILIQGKIPDDEQGLEAHKKSLNRAYRSFKSRGFKDENIIYLNYDLEQSKLSIEVDNIPNLTNIDSAFQTIQTKMANIPAPLYVVMVGHGDIEGRFYLDENTILPNDINHWLTRLENHLNAFNANTKKYPRIVIVGACYSGNYIPILSKAGRIIITSTTQEEVSYKGPKEPDQVRSGDYFMEAFFAEFEQGHSLQDAFTMATNHVEILTQLGSNASFNPYFQDAAAQHPLLDDNGDQMGSNILPTLIEGQAPEQAEGFKAEQIYLGVGAHFQRNNPNAPAMILTVTPTKSLETNAVSIELSASVNNPNRVKDNQVIVDIRPPEVTLRADGITHKGQLAVNGLKRVILKPNSTSGNRFTGNFAQLTTPGKYNVFYFVQDSETGEISPLKHSIFYQNKDNNNPPSDFDLIEPANQTETSTTVIFGWNKSLDPDHDPINYTFIVGTDLGLTHEVYRQEGLLLPMTYIDNATIINQGTVNEHVGLRDDTTYYWKVLALDGFGKMTSSATFSFTTNNKNQPPNINFGISCRSDYDVPLELGDSQYSEENFYQPQPQFGCQGYWRQILSYSYNRIASGATRKTLRRKPSQTTNPGKIQFLTNDTIVPKNQGQIELIVERVAGDQGALSVPYMIIGDDESHSKNNALTWADKDSSLRKINLDTNQYHKTITVILLDNGKNILGTPNQITITLLEETGQAATSPIAPPEPPLPIPGVENPPIPTDATGNPNTNPTGELGIQNSGEKSVNSSEKKKESVSIPENQQSCSTTTEKEVKNPPSLIPLPSGTLQFPQHMYKVNANQKSVRITVTRQDGKFYDVSVKYIIDISPPIEGELSWEHNDENPKSFDIPINEKLLTTNEVIELRLVNPNRAKLGRSEAVLQIINKPKKNIEPPVVECQAPPEPDNKIEPAECPYTFKEDDNSIIISLSENDVDKKIVVKDFFGTSLLNCNVQNVPDELDLPDLGEGVIFGSYGDFEYDNTDTTFSGGIAVDEGNYKIDDIVSTYDSVVITGEITVAPEHVGEKADILVVVHHIPLNIEAKGTFHMFNTGEKHVSVDISQPEMLLPFMRGITLQSTQTVEMYRGEFHPVTGHLRFFFGYRLENDDIIFNGKQEINVTVEW